MQKPFVDTVCPHCKFGALKTPSNGQEWHVSCNECGAITFCYVPMPHQEEFHKDNAKFRMWAGGFGSAKTSTCAAEMVRHCIETPNGMCLIGAQTYPQLEETAKKMFMDMMPQEFVLNYEKQKNKMTLINGHQILFRSFDDEGKIRSLNLTAWWIN
jgi:phage terminase large subunit